MVCLVIDLVVCPIASVVLLQEQRRGTNPSRGHRWVFRAIPGLGAGQGWGRRGWRSRGLAGEQAIGAHFSNLRAGGLAPQQPIHRAGHIPMHQPAVTGVHLDR